MLTEKFVVRIKAGFTFPQRREKCRDWRKMKLKLGKLYKHRDKKKTKLMYYVQQTGQVYVH
jgi:hypothetical protein